jgi:inner membrane protein involved in colicin E2 resistance
MYTAGRIVFLLILVTSIVIIFIYLTPQTMAQTLKNDSQPAVTNFSDVISQQVSSDQFLVSIVYEKSKDSSLTR